MSKSRQKGTSWEVELLPALRIVFGEQVERAPLRGTQDHGDFTGIPHHHLVEAKKTDVPHFLQWAKTCEKKEPGNWSVVWSGDRRKGDGPFVLMPMDFWLSVWDRALHADWLEVHV